MDLIRERARELKYLLTMSRRPRTRSFFGRLFRLAWRRGRLRWRSRWAFLVKRGGILRGRRLRPGSGLRALSVVWAGLSSLGRGVRRAHRWYTKIRLGLKTLKESAVAKLKAALALDPRKALSTQLGNLLALGKSRLPCPKAVLGQATSALAASPAALGSLYQQ